MQYHQPDSIILLVQCSGFQPAGREPFLEGPPPDILCTELYYICFIQVLDGVVRLEWVAVMGHGTKS